jgi:hypothetical protein
VQSLRIVVLDIRPGQAVGLRANTSKTPSRVLCNRTYTERVHAGEVHPAMAAFGLWVDEADLTNLADEIAANRRHFDRVPELVVEDWLSP